MRTFCFIQYHSIILQLVVSNTRSFKTKSFVFNKNDFEKHKRKLADGALRTFLECIKDIEFSKEINIIPNWSPLADESGRNSYHISSGVIFFKRKLRNGTDKSCNASLERWASSRACQGSFTGYASRGGHK